LIYSLGRRINSNIIVPLKMGNGFSMIIKDRKIDNKQSKIDFGFHFARVLTISMIAATKAPRSKKLK
jgi:hypothetical protein